MPGQSPPPLGPLSRSPGAGGTLAAYPSLASQKEAWGAVRGGQGRTTAAPAEGALAAQTGIQHFMGLVWITAPWEDGVSWFRDWETERQSWVQTRPPSSRTGTPGVLRPQARGASLSGSPQWKRQLFRAVPRAFCHGVGPAGTQAG